MRTPLYKAGNGDNDAPELNLTPLIDVVFILLIFFLVTITVNQRREVKANAASENGKQTEAPIVLLLAEDGTVRNLQGEILTDSVQNLQNEVNQDTMFVIRPSASVSPKVLIGFMQKLQAAGFTKISLQEDGE